MVQQEGERPGIYDGEDSLWKTRGLGWLKPFLVTSLQGRLIIPYVILTVLLAVIGTFVVTRLVTASIRERFVNRLFEAGRVAADVVVRKERSHLETLRLMAFTEGVSGAIRAGDAQKLQELLLPLVVNDQVEILTVVDADGKEVLTIAGDFFSQGLFYSNSASLGQVDLVARTLAGESDELGDKFTGILPTARGRALFTSAPVRDAEGRVSGALLLGTTLDSLLGDMENNQDWAYFVLLDQDFHLLSASLPEPEEGYAIFSAAGQTPDGGTHDLKINGRDYQAVYAPFMVRRQQLGYLGTILPSSYVVATEATSRNLFSAIFTIGTVATILTGYLLSRSIARPILRLRSLSQAVASGDLNQEVGLKRADEIGELASAFDQMTRQLRQRTEEAERLYAESIQRNRELEEINERLQNTQRQLIQSEKLAAIGKLSAGIVHDIKNPLTVVMGVSELLLEDEKVVQMYSRELGLVHESAVKANRIVSDLLKFARRSQPTMAPGDLVDTVEAALRLTAFPIRKSKVQVVKDLPPEPVMMVFDQQQIEQVLVNVINNAVQAMPSGGRLIVRVRQDETTGAIDVQDTGCGISPEIASQIFDPFFTTKPEGEGTGLGLSVSYGIVANHRGRIDVDSQPGQGATFTILLPKTQDDDLGEFLDAASPVQGNGRSVCREFPVEVS